MSDQHHIGHGGFSPYVLTSGTTEERQAHSIPPEDLVYARKSEINRLRNQRDEAVALLREVRSELAAQIDNDSREGYAWSATILSEKVERIDVLLSRLEGA